MLKRLDPDMLVAGQIFAPDVAALAAQGVTMIVNNRPDGEERGQPASAEIAAAAAAAAIVYRHIPVSSGFSADQVMEMAEALDQGARILAFCKSGTRSTLLWALARAQLGDDPEELRSKAQAAGYDLSPIAALLQSH